MAGWIERLVDEPEHPDVPWKPKAIGTVSDLRAALFRVETLLSGRVTEAYAKQCFAKLMVAFEPNTKLSGDETRMRMAVWLEANGDLPDELWAEATSEAIRGLKWMPKPGEFRDLAVPHIHRAKLRVSRIKAMINAHAQGDMPYERDPWEVRIKTMRDTFRRIGNVARASMYERQLAEHEGREPEDWAKEPQP